MKDDLRNKAMTVGARKVLILILVDPKLHTTQDLGCHLGSPLGVGTDENQYSVNEGTSTALAISFGNTISLRVAVHPLSKSVQSSTSRSTLRSTRSALVYMVVDLRDLHDSTAQI